MKNLSFRPEGASVWSWETEAWIWEIGVWIREMEAWIWGTGVWIREMVAWIWGTGVRISEMGGLDLGNKGLELGEKETWIWGIGVWILLAGLELSWGEKGLGSGQRFGFGGQGLSQRFYQVGF